MNSTHPAETLPPRETRAPLLLGVTWTWTLLSIIFTALRFYAWKALPKKLWWDDWWILLATLLSISMAIEWSYYTSIGGGQHEIYLTKAQISSGGRINWISHASCILALTASKIAVACLLKRLQAPCRWRTVVLWVMLSTMAVYNVVQVSRMYTQCRPTAILWEGLEAHPGGTCEDGVVFHANGIAISSYMAFVDVALAALGVQMIWGLKMPLQRKLLICCLLSSGVFACGFAVLKTIEISSLLAAKDLSWVTVNLLIWNACEVNMIIVAACVPTVTPLLLAYLGIQGGGAGDTWTDPTAGTNPRSRAFNGGRNSPHPNNSISGYRKDADAASDEVAFHNKVESKFEPETQFSGSARDRGIVVTREFELTAVRESHMV